MPNGILVVDLKSKEIVLANREMETLVNNVNEGPNQQLTFKEKICNFLMQKVVVSNENENMEDQSYSRFPANK